MSNLSNYSIETDHTVLLSFKDGRRLRVPLDELSRHLGAEDLAKVTRAIKLRRDFIRRHMPKAVLVLVAGGLVALTVITTPQLVAWILHRPSPASPPAPVQPQPQIVRNLQQPEPAVTPSPSAIAQDTTTTIPSTKRRKSLAKKVHIKSIARLKSAAKNQIASTQPVVSPPVPSPAPPPANNPGPVPSPSPTPLPSPTPTPIPEQGQVLGDSTGPTKP